MLGNFGAYPDSPCYDPTRSSWLPYWFNNLTEQLCFNDQVALAVGMYPGVTTLTPVPAPPNPPAVGVPSDAVISGSGSTPAQAQAIQDKLIADQTAAWKAQTQAFFNDLAAKEDNRQKGCPWYQTMDSSDVCGVGGWKLWAVAIGGAAALFYFKTQR